MSKMKLAIPTKGNMALDDVVSEVFGKAENFTLIEIKDSSIVSVEVVKNPAASYKHGAGPIVVKMLAEKGVTAVAARELGLGASTLLEQNNMKKYHVKAGIPVKEAVKTVLGEMQV